MSDLDRLESELDDVETALACLSRGEPGLCDPCVAANDEGTLLVRPGLWACAEGRIAGAPSTATEPAVVVDASEASESEAVQPREEADTSEAQA